jgi:hypothetical protein
VLGVFGVLGKRLGRKGLLVIAKILA